MRRREAVDLVNEFDGDVLSIKSNGFTECIFLNRKPLVATWYDNYGSVGQLLAQLEIDESIKIEVSADLCSQLNSGFMIDLETLSSKMEEFLKLFPKGDYTISNWDYENEVKDGFLDHINYTRFNQFCFVKPTLVVREEKEKYIEKYNELVSDRLSKGYDINVSLLDFTTTNDYDPDNSCLLLLQCIDSLDESRISYYEGMIKNNSYPYLLVYNTVFNDDYESKNYLLDGHHKLMAYHRSKVNPRIISITHKLWSSEIFDPAIFMPHLHDWQAEHIFRNYYNSQDKIDAILKSNNLYLKKFIRNGEVKIYYPNGKIKSVATYKNDIARGIMLEYYINGNPRKVSLYKVDGRVQRYLKAWYNSGELQSIYIIESDRVSRQESYYKNGNISSVSEFVDNKYKDGLSSKSFYQDGSIQYEVEYQNNKVVKQRWYNLRGDITQER